MIISLRSGGRLERGARRRACDTLLDSICQRIWKFEKKNWNLRAVRPQCAKSFPLIKWKIRNFGPISLKFGIGTPLDPKWRIPERGSLRTLRAPAVRENIYAYLVKNPQFWSDFAQIRDWNPFGSHMKNLWKGLASRSPRARNVLKCLCLFSKKSANLV